VRASFSAYLGDVDYVVGRQGDFQGCFVGGVVHLDGELGQVEQAVEQLVRRAMQV
jgi:hypothetical protein